MDGAILDEALELGNLVLPAVPGHAAYLEIPGLVARASAIPSPFVNQAGRLRLRAEGGEADRALDKLCTHFQEAEAPFGVMLGPASTPSDLPARLAARGLRLQQRCLGLVLEDLAAEVPAPGGDVVVVKKVGRGQRAAFDRVKAEAFAMPLAVAEQIDDLLFGGVAAAGAAIVFHLASVGGEPVGFAQTFYHRGVAILGGAGVVPSARGKGAFRALLAARLRLAHKDGLGAATIQAYDHTSAPILQRLGFQRRCELELWSWTPRAA